MTKLLLFSLSLILLSSTGSGCKPGRPGGGPEPCKWTRRHPPAKNLKLPTVTLLPQTSIEEINGDKQLRFVFSIAGVYSHASLYYRQANEQPSSDRKLLVGAIAATQSSTTYQALVSRGSLPEQALLSIRFEAPYQEYQYQHHLCPDYGHEYFCKQHAGHAYNTRYYQVEWALSKDWLHLPVK